MITATKEKVHALRVSSIEELQSAIDGIMKKDDGCVQFISLAVDHPDFIVSPFQFGQAPIKEIKNLLILEAVELLSLPADDIGLEYQICDTSDEKLRGLFVCYPKELVHEFLSVIDRAGCIPVKIVPSLIAGMDTFLSQYKENKGRYCLFDFSREGLIHFAVFSDHHCDFIRKIPYENPNEIEREVVQSLRYACAKNSIKKFDRIYFSGNIARKNILIDQIKDLFCPDVIHGYFMDVEASLKKAHNTISLNLIQPKTLSLSERKKINVAARVILFLAFFVILFQGIGIFMVESEINHLKTEYKASDYEHAKDLQQRLQSL